ncbi:MAG: amidohydrolase family protein [Gemmatimonadota bacterium]|jgi:cytosine/adenosine deaminase-related metal-dependent hydrolase|nr:amidohydrolase family protein [Gemmatimonadota bacterium]
MSLTAASLLVLAALGAASPPPTPAPHRAPKPVVDLLVTGGTVITMDATRRILDDGAIAIRGDRIVAVGPSREVAGRFAARRTINARRQIIMPGLIDGHGHAGHTLVKTLGMDTGEWYAATDAIYARGSTTNFWRADALLAATEKLRFGVTTSLVLFGGGDNVHRTDDRKYGDAYLEGIERVGLRWFLAVGPRRPPFPKVFTDLDGPTPRDVPVSFERQLEVSEQLIKTWNGRGNGRVHVAVVYPTIHPKDIKSPEEGAELARQARLTRDLSKQYGLIFTQDGHTTGSVAYANSLGLLGPDAVLSHATELTPEEIRIVAQTNTRISHNPSAIYSMRGRNPAIELMDAGATVMLGSDGVAPDRSYDMFRHMFQAGRYHRFHFRDPDVLPSGKILEMVTVDAARALGLEREVGSLEVGKKADLILVDWWRPHLVPMQMAPYRIALFANGNDVHTVIVDGRVLMRNRQVLSVSEDSVLAMAQREADAAIRRTGLDSLTRLPEGFWGATRLPKRRP